MEEFELQLASVPDKEELVVEILFKNSIIAEISRSNIGLEIEIYPLPKEFLVLPLVKFQEIIEDAKKMMLR